MIRRFLFVFILAAAALPARAQLKVEADYSDADYRSGETLLTGNVRVSDAGMLLTADAARYANLASVTALGHVVLTSGATRLLADKLVYRSDGTFVAEHVRLGGHPYFIAGASATGTLGPKRTVSEIVVTHATVTYGEPGPWQPTMIAETITFVPGQRLRAENSRVGVGQFEFLPLPRFQQDLHESLAMFAAVTGGYNHSFGAFVEGRVHVPSGDGVRLGGDLGIFTSRGVMFGPSGSYSRGPDGADLSGFFRTGFIDDHGSRLTDILGRPVPEGRGFVEWQHAQQLADNLTFTAQLNWWSDSEVLRDYRPREFFPVQAPDTFAESAYSGPNYFLSVFARLQPNSFEQVPQRLPEVRFDLLPLALPGGFSERFNASAAMLREDPLPVGPLTPTPAIPGLRSNRLDAYYALERPIAVGDYFAFTPVAGGRVTYYADTVGAAEAGGYTRTLGELGFDAALRTSGTFDYTNALWGIDGLRHLLTPRLSYRYIPEADKGTGRIPQIDTETFSTYLQPLGLGDVRNIDQLHATDTLRLGFDNTVQTRDPVYGSRDLFTFNLAADFKFQRAPGAPSTSDVNTEIAFAPAPWLQVDAFNRLTPQTGTLQEFNTGVTLHDGDAWSVRFANNYLHHQIQDYLLDGRVRLNERYQALARLQYDARTRRFNEQAYGITQNLDNTWRVSYVTSLYSGPRRESHFGFNVQIEATGF